jgi:hypothetical protein
MTSESSHGFILWGVPRFRRANAIVHDARKADLTRASEKNTEASLSTASYSGPARCDVTVGLEDPEITACRDDYCTCH